MTLADDDRRCSRRQLRTALPAAPLLCAIAVYVWLITRMELYGDESFSATSASLPRGDLLHLLGHREMNGAAHFLLLKVGHLGTAPEWAVRLPSTLFVALAALLVWRFLAARVSLVIVFACVTLFALNSEVVGAAITGRQYGLMILISTATFLFAERIDRTQDSRAAFGLGIVGSIGFYTHFFVAFEIAAQIGFLVLGPGRQVALTRTVPILTVAAIPAAFFVVAGGDNGQNSWVPATTVHRAWAEPLNGFILTGGVHTAMVGAMFLAPLAVIGITAHFRRDGSSRPMQLAALSIAGPLFLGVLASLATPLLVSRYFAAVVPPSIIIIGLGTDRLLEDARARRWRFSRLRHWPLVPVALALMATAVSLPHANDGQVTGWPEALTFIRQHSSQGDGVDTVTPIEWTSVAYYVRGRRARGVRYRSDDIRRLHQELAADSYNRVGCWRSYSGRRVWLTALNGSVDQPGPTVTGYAACMGLEIRSTWLFGHVAIYELR